VSISVEDADDIFGRCCFLGFFLAKILILILYKFNFDDDRV